MIFAKNLPFFNVVGDGVASLSLPMGMTYERIILVLGGTTFTNAMITDIKVKLNGKVAWQTTGSRQNTMNLYRGITTDATHLTLDFTEIFARDEVGQSIGAIGTLGLSNFTIEVTIAGATAPTLESYSQMSGPKNVGIVTKVLSYPVSFSAGGKFPIVLPYGQNGGSVIKRVNFFNTYMIALEVKKNGLVIHESVKAINEFLQIENQKAPQSGLYVGDFIVDNKLSGMLRTDDARSMEWNVTVSQADTVTVQVEYIDLVTNL